MINEIVFQEVTRLLQEVKGAVKEVLTSDEAAAC